MITQNSLYMKGHVGDISASDSSMCSGNVLGNRVCIIDVGAASMSCEWISIFIVGGLQTGHTTSVYLNSCADNEHGMLHRNWEKNEWMTSYLSELVHTTCEDLKQSQKECVHNAFENISMQLTKCIGSGRTSQKHMVLDSVLNWIRSLREKWNKSQSNKTDKAINHYITTEMTEPDMHKIIFCRIRRLMSRCTSRIIGKRIQMLHTGLGLVAERRLEISRGYPFQFGIRRRDVWLSTAS